MNNKPYFIPFREGSGAGEVQVDAHWCFDVKFDDGSIICGMGSTREEALENAGHIYEEQVRILKLSSKEQLKILIEKNPTYFNSGVHNTALRLISEILIGEKIK